MKSPDLSNNPALWLGLRQTEALREALVRTLLGESLAIGQSISEWSGTQSIPVYPDLPERAVIRQALVDGFEKGVGVHPDLLCRGSNAPAPDWINLGEKRAGAGWQNPANFLITSAFVRLLGAFEQFELDVLKALFYYRPTGHPLGDKRDWEPQEVDPAVIEETPQPDPENKDKEIYIKQPLWTWLRKQAENNVERQRIFKSVFRIKLLPAEYIGKQREQWYKSRNKIAHGRAGIEMTLGEYIEVDVFVAKSMLYISEQCRDKLALIV